MQTLSTYLFEQKNLTPERCSELKEHTNNTIYKWLKEKGVTDPNDPVGEFISKTPGGGGNYLREHFEHDEKTLEEISLEENSNHNQKFTTRISIITTIDSLSIYILLSTTSTISIITPINVGPRCPAVVRDLIRDNKEWKLNGETVPSGEPIPISGESNGISLSSAITSPNRTFPIVVLSTKNGSTIFPALDKQLSYDLAGLAYVAVVDEAAAEALSDELGKDYSCYNGSVQLYWPHTASSKPMTAHLWTSSRLISMNYNGDGKERFRSAIRKRVMSVSAATIVPPKEISRIKIACSRRRLSELEGKVSSFDEIYSIAQSYAKDVESLTADKVQLQADLSIAITRAENAEAMYESIIEENQNYQGDQYEDTELETDEQKSSEEIATGEYRFYKKTHSKPTYDVMVLISDCGHNNWESAPKAEKAKKGVERFEGRNDWSTFSHCNTCQGGGVWRVKW